ncbi:MAG: hypothetical protein MO852_08495 [Candidatus Devosia euplotis]|nr:hypothetical protein [Candidatus Devosia euplotis]
MGYINQALGNGALLPGSAREQALAMQWVLWQNNELGSHWSYPLRAIIRKESGFDEPDKLAAEYRCLDDQDEDHRGTLGRGR